MLDYRRSMSVGQGRLAAISLGITIGFTVFAAAAHAGADLPATQTCVAADATAGPADGCGVETAGLRGVHQLTVSPDGESLYAVAMGLSGAAYHSSLAVFARDTDTGALTAQQCFSGGTSGEAGDPGCTARANMGEIVDVEVSPDGGTVYTASRYIIQIYDRAADGTLTYLGCVIDGPRESSPCAAQSLGTNYIQDFDISPDGGSAYAVASDADAVSVFDVDPGTGLLTPLGCVHDAQRTVGDNARDDCTASAEGLDGARGLVVSPDSESVYVKSWFDDAIAAFSRNASTGALTGIGCIEAADSVDASCATDVKSTGGRALAMSPDGTQLVSTGLRPFARNTETGALTPPPCLVAGSTETCPTGDWNSAEGDIDMGPEGRAILAAPSNGSLLGSVRSTASGQIWPGSSSASSLTSAVNLSPLFSGGIAISPDGLDVYTASEPRSSIFRARRIAPLAAQTFGDNSPTGLDRTPTFTFSASEPGATFECAPNDQPFGACSGPGASHTPAAPLPDGEYELRVRAVLDGVPDPTPVRWLIDVREFTLSFEERPDAIGSDETPAFRFATNAPDGVAVTYECAIDDAPLAPCSADDGHLAGPLADGGHTLEVRATEQGGGQVTRQLAFIIDTTAPRTEIASGPDGRTTDRTPTFRFDGGDSPVARRGAGALRFQCSVDGGRFRACDSPERLRKLDFGRHTFQVRARDAAGNRDRTPAQARFKVVR
jgi:DNA-binding beta-propeller fold protein YncE